MMSGTRSEDPIIIYADGASSGNPGPGGWGALILMPHLEIIELGGRIDSTTNNRMELTAAITCLNQVKDSNLRISLHTDSKYVIQGAESWLRGWKKSGWKTKEGKDVANRDLWEKLDLILSHMKPTPQWVYVAGHTGVAGNDRADQIAVSFSLGETPHLYRGPLSGYSLSKEELLKTEGTKTNSRSRSKLQALHYLSLVGRVPMRHKTWAECENRVRGQTGAKFKKVTTPDEEEKILKDWGYGKSDLKG